MHGKRLLYSIDLLGGGARRDVLFRAGREKAFLCTKKGYYIPLIYWAEVPGSGGKTPPI